MDIKWSALGEVALVSFGVGVAITVIFAVGVLASSLGQTGSGEPGSPERGGTLANVAAGLCFLACALITAYGIYLIVPQFH
jgi:hypothetical protein